MGCYGYVVVAAVFVVYTFVAGFISSFGVFVDQFDRAFCQPDDCLDVLALVSALALANYRLLCWLVVIIEKQFSSILLFLIGLILCVTSMIMTSYINNLSTLFITHSLLYGFGSTLMLNSPLKVIEQYFPRTHPRHVLTTSIMNLGTPLGVVMMNPLAVYLDEHEFHSWRDTFKILGAAIGFSGLFYMAVLIKPYLVQRKSKEYENLDDDNLELVAPDASSEGAPLREVINTLSVSWLVGLFLVCCGIFIPKTLFMQYMTNTKGIKAQSAAIIMSCNGIAEAVCTFIISIVGDFLSFHILVVYILGSTLLSAGCFLLPYVTSPSQIAAYSVMHGAIDGLLMSVLFSVVRHVSMEPSHLKTMWSLTNLAVGLGQLIGLPIAGYLYDKFKSYDVVFYFASALFLANTIMFFVAYGVRFYEEPFPENVGVTPTHDYDEPFQHDHDTSSPEETKKSKTPNITPH